MYKAFCRKYIAKFSHRAETDESGNSQTIIPQTRVSLAFARNKLKLWNGTENFITLRMIEKF